MKKFTFNGTTTIKRPFSIDIFASNEEEAEEQALLFLEDVEDDAYYQFDEEEVEIEIEEAEEERIRIYQ